MIVSIIAALSEVNRGIGFQGKLPWRLKTDLLRFKSLTMGHTLIMGRKTYQSLGRESLPEREIIVVSQTLKHEQIAPAVCHSIEAALGVARNIERNNEIFICGGEQIYQQTIHLAQKMYLTFVDAYIAADAFFPEFNWDSWQICQNIVCPQDEHNQFSSKFYELERTF
jgi:dihydrofolate reductase